MTISYTTFQDVIDHGVDYLGGNPSNQGQRDCVRAALEAYRDLVNAHNWSYFYSEGRIITNGSYESGASGATLSYLKSSGTYPRQVTITGDVWPAWAGDGILRIASPPTTSSGSGYDSVDHGPTSTMVNYKVDQRISATVLTLDETISPADDIPAGTPFLLYQDTYLLPEDYIAQDQALYELNFGGMQFTHPRDWLFENRYVFAAGVPQYFTITGDLKYPGRLVMRIFPWPIEQKTIEFVYKRRPRPLLTPLYKAGTVSVSNGSPVVTGVSTVFSPKMVGSTVRISGNSRPPSSLIMGDNVSVFESIVQSWVSPTSVVMQDAADASWSGVGYTISDTVDIEPGAMLNAYLRCVEKHISMSRTLKDKPSAARQYTDALAEAKAADSRSFMGRAAGRSGRYRPRLSDMPLGPDQA